MTRRKKIILYPLLALAALALAVVVAGVLVLRSNWFHDKVRDRIVAEVEKGSGGKAEIGAFQFDWETMTATVRPFVLHGKERAGERPLLRAESIQVGLKVISAFRRDVDVASVTIDNPELNIIVYPDGTTNLPSPRQARASNPVEQLIALKVARFQVRNGWVQFQERRVPFDVRGEGLQAALEFDAPGSFYIGRLVSKQVHFQTDTVGPLVANLDTDVRLFGNRVEFRSAQLSTKASKAEAVGTLSDWRNLHGDFRVKASVSLAELGKPLLVPISHRGTADFDGTLVFTLAEKFVYRVDGRLHGRGLAYRDGNVEISGATLDSTVEVTPEGVKAPRVRVAALGGSFAGSAELPGFHEFRLRGDASGLSLADLARLEGRRVPWSATITGPVQASGVLGTGGPRDVLFKADVALAPLPGGIPLSGRASIDYSQRTGVLNLGDSDISTPKSHVAASGVLGSTLKLNVETSDLRELEPALEFFANRREPIPVELANGTASLNGTVTGPAASPVLQGHVALTNVVVEGRKIDSVAADVVASKTGVQARNVDLRRGPTRVTGSAQAGLVDWKLVPESPISVALDVAADVKELGAEAGQKDFAMAGTASGSVRLAGTYGTPTGEARLQIDRPVVAGEPLDSLRANVRFDGARTEILNGEARSGAARVDFSGSYTHAPDDWKTGSIRFQASSRALPLTAIRQVHEARSDLAGSATFRAAGTATLTKGVFDLQTLDSEANLRSVTLAGGSLGDFVVNARTRGDILDISLRGNLRESRVEGSGEWTLKGDYPGKGEVRFTRMGIPTVKALLSQATGQAQDLPFEGLVEGSVAVSGPLKKPDQIAFAATFPRVEIAPSPEQRVRAGVRPSDLVLRNVGPVVVRGTSKKMTVERAHFTATDTSLDVRGSVGFTQSPWDLTVNGGINLAILQLFNRDLNARGSAIVNASVRGALRDPQVNGTLELRNASLYLGDLTTGIDRANGTVLFDRSRATIQKLTAEVGGGTVNLGGFVGFGGGLLMYRVQANADQVRVRYPEGVSTTLNANVSLTGTSANSLVSGTVTVMRAGLTPQADIGGILAASQSNALGVPETPSELLRNIQLDIRIQSGPSLAFTTSFGRDIQADAELRLRGTAARPVLLGTVSVTEGEIQLFGTKYEISRGEIRFINPTRIEPYFDVDLVTRARGIDVTISFSGTPNKLNMTYRSDPPLQPNEIVALIAMGRDPNALAGLASAQVASQSLMQTGSGAVGQAISAPVSNRLQRFFGVSRLKIDPQLTGVENIPQARLTLEQQISRDITLTYITNLARTNEQIWRIQWDINRRWSAIATREENGVFGIDFQYRKRFK